MYILCERQHSEQIDYILYRKTHDWNLLSNFGRITFRSIDLMCDSMDDPDWGGNRFVADKVLDGTYNQLAIFEDWEGVLRIRETHPELFI